MRFSVNICIVTLCNFRWCFTLYSGGCELNKARPIRASPWLQLLDETSGKSHSNSDFLPDILPYCRSMRKTRLLLDAVEVVGRHDVTFAALDLCEDSLSQALTALHGESKPDRSNMTSVNQSL